MSLLIYCLIYAVKLVSIYSTKNLIFFFGESIHNTNYKFIKINVGAVYYIFIVVPLKEEGAIMFSRSGMAKDYDFVTIIIFNFGNHYG